MRRNWPGNMQGDPGYVPDLESLANPDMRPPEMKWPGAPPGTTGGTFGPPIYPPTNIPTYPESAPLGGGGVGNYPMGPTNPLPVPKPKGRWGVPPVTSPRPSMPGDPGYVPNLENLSNPDMRPPEMKWPGTYPPGTTGGTFGPPKPPPKGGGMGLRSGAGSGGTGGMRPGEWGGQTGSRVPTPSGADQIAGMGGSRGMSLLPPPPPKPSGGGGSPPAPTGGGDKWNEQIPGMPGGGYGGMGPDAFGDRYRRRQNLPGGGVTGGIPMGSGGNQISPFNPNAALPSQKSVMAPRPNSANNNRFSTGGNMIANRMKGGYRGAQGGGGYSGQVSGRYQTPSGGMNSFDTGGLNANPGGTYSPMSPGMPQPGRPSPQPRAPRQPRYPSFADPNMGWGGSLRRSPAMTFNQGNTNINNQLTQQGPRIARNMGRMGGYNPMMFGGQSRQIGGLRNLMQMLAAMRGGRR